MENQTKKKRSRQFSHEETSRLLCLIEDEPIITSKKTDVTTNSEKDRAWKRVCTKFNAVGTYLRDVGALRLKWDNLKKAAKKRSTAITINNRATGGGPSTIVPDAILDRVISLTSISCFGLPNQFDNDADTSEQPDAQVMHTATEEEGTSTIADCVVVSQDAEVPTTSNTAEEMSRWKNWTPADLKRPVSTKLKSSKKMKNTSIHDKLVESKIERNKAIAEYYKAKLEIIKNKENLQSDDSD